MAGGASEGATAVSSHTVDVGGNRGFHQSLTGLGGDGFALRVLRVFK
jgi:hypothetical protein